MTDDDYEFAASKSIPVEQLEDRAVYIIYCRNLYVGVWDVEHCGFLGVREKFGDKYLFMEYHWEKGPPYGTARAYRKLDLVIPPEIHITEGLGSFCRYCDTPTRSMGPGMGKDHEGQPREVQCVGWTHINAEDREACEFEGSYMSVGKMNRPLFDLLLPYDESEHRRRRPDVFEDA